MLTTSELPAGGGDIHQASVPLDKAESGHLQTVHETRRGRHRR
jgi:hypothetical protein